MLEAILIFVSGLSVGAVLGMHLVDAPRVGASEIDEMRALAEHCDRVSRLAHVNGYAHNARLYEEKARRARDVVSKLLTESNGEMSIVPAHTQTRSRS